MLIVVNTLVSALIIGLAAWMSRRYPSTAGFLVALPLATLLVLPMAYLQHRDAASVFEMARSILEAGEFPRGVGQSPDAMLPGDDPDAATVQAATEKARERWASLDDQAEAIEASTVRLPHPALGPLTAAEWLRFASIHGRHHLRIVDEILG